MRVEPARGALLAAVNLHLPPALGGDMAAWAGGCRPTGAYSGGGCTFAFFLGGGPC